MQKNVPNIFEYTDYRVYLKDFVGFNKKTNPALGTRYLSRKAGFRSPATLGMVLSGKRRLGLSAVDNVSKALSLKGSKKIYFEKLVRAELSKNAHEKMEIQHEITKLRNRKTESPLSSEQYRVLGSWYSMAIYELVATKSFKYELKSIVKRLKNLVTASQVSQAIEDLKAVGLLVEVEGQLERKDVALCTSEDLKNLAIQKYHSEMLKKAGEALLLPVEERDLSGLTVAVKKSDLPKIKEKIRQFRKELNEQLSQSDDPDDVYQFNIQFFPLTKESKCE